MAEIISNGKIYVDFGATAGASGGGAILLDFASQLKVNDQSSTEVVKSIGKRRGAGFRDKAGGFSLTLTENRQTVPQVNWRAVKKDKKIFTITVQDENGGVREKFRPCKVSKIDRSMSDEGEHQDEIEIVSLDSV